MRCALVTGVQTCALPISPVLGVLVNCSAFRPGNAIECATPSVFIAMSATFDSMASVRAIDAPSGSLTPAIRYSLSWVGMNPAGTALHRSEQRRLGEDGGSQGRSGGSEFH